MRLFRSPSCAAAGLPRILVRAPSVCEIRKKCTMGVVFLVFMNLRRVCNTHIQCTMSTPSRLLKLDFEGSAKPSLVAQNVAKRVEVRSARRGTDLWRPSWRPSFEFQQPAKAKLARAESSGRDTGGCHMAAQPGLHRKSLAEVSGRRMAEPARPPRLRASARDAGMAAGSDLSADAAAPAARKLSPR
jgi:hypothetical protein